MEEEEEDAGEQGRETMKRKEKGKKCENKRIKGNKRIRKKEYERFPVCVCVC